MADLLIMIAAPAVAWFVTDRWSRSLPLTAPLRRRNYRGIEVATACGITIIGGFVVAVGLMVFAHVLLESPLIDRAGRVAPSSVIAATGFGLLGLWDDIAGGDQARGWRAHLLSMRDGAPSSGAVKLLGGMALSFVLVAGRADGVLAAVVGTGVLAGSANLFNLLDLRPGRATKFWLVCAAGIAFALAIVGASGASMTLLAGAAAVVAFMRHDLAERAMLGDVGANAIGALIGIALISFDSLVVSSAALAVLVALHVVSDKPGLSRLIAAVPPLRTFDRAGRAPSDAG